MALELLLQYLCLHYYLDVWIWETLVISVRNTDKSSLGAEVITIPTYLAAHVSKSMSRVYAPVSELLSASFPATLKTSCTKTVTMLRRNLYALLETGSKPAMNTVSTYTQGSDTYRIFMIS